MWSDLDFGYSLISQEMLQDWQSIAGGRALCQEKFLIGCDSYFLQFKEDT
jgi:hypothetical protein